MSELKGACIIGQSGGAMSANAFAEDIINSRLAGMNAHLAKPLDAEKMIVALKQCMADNRDIKLHEDL